MKCQRIDTGDPVTVHNIAKKLISDRHGIRPPAHAGCWQVQDDALRPGHYLLVGWLLRPTLSKPVTKQIL